LSSYASGRLLHASPKDDWPVLCCCVLLTPFRDRYIEHVAPFGLRLCVRVQPAALRTPPSDARSPSRDPLRASWRGGLLPRCKLWSPSPDPIQSPWDRVATAHPLGKYLPHYADKSEETEPKHHVQQNHSRRPPRMECKSEKQLRIIASTSRSTSQPRKAGRTTRASMRPAPNGIASSHGVLFSELSGS
jgi:hypothetical protein